MPELQGPFIGFRGWTVETPVTREGCFEYEEYQDEETGLWALRISKPTARLKSVVQDFYWPRGVIEAECLLSYRARFDEPAKDPRHKAPDSDCNCGNYSYFSPMQLAEGGHGDTVIGATINWGEVEIHEDGMRSEFAQIVCIGIPEIMKEEKQTKELEEYYEANMVYQPERYLHIAVFNEALNHGKLFPEAEINKMHSERAAREAEDRAYRNRQAKRGTPNVWTHPHIGYNYQKYLNTNTTNTAWSWSIGNAKATALDKKKATREKWEAYYQQFYPRKSKRK